MNSHLYDEKDMANGTMAIGDSQKSRYKNSIEASFE